MTAFLGGDRTLPLADAIARYGAERLREALVAKRAVAVGREGLPDPTKTPPERIGIPAAAWDGAAFLPDSCARLADGRIVHDVVVLATGLEGRAVSPETRRNPGGRPERGDWAEFDREVVRILALDGGCITRTELRRRMIAWATERMTPPPDDRTVARRIDKLAPPDVFAPDD